jgi:hypothetical protein
MPDEIPTSDSPEAAVAAFIDEDDAPAEREEAGEDKPDEEEEKPNEEEPAPRTYKAKANGREIDIPAEQVDVLAKALNVDPGVIVRGAQMFRAGQDKAREAADILKKAESIQAKIKQDPRAALREAVGDEEFRKLAVQAVREMMEEDELRAKNPEELERRKAQSELEKLRAEKEALAKEAETREESAFQDKIAADLNKQITTLLDAGKLPRDPYVIRRLAAYIHDHVSSENVDDLSLEDYLPVVVDEIQAEHTQFLGKLSGDDIIERFPEMAEKVREAYTKRVRRGGPPARQPERREREAPRNGAGPKRTGTGGALDAFLRGD